MRRAPLFSKSFDQGERTRAELLVETVKRNEDNPRLIFSAEGMTQLRESIRNDGILVPLTVYRHGNEYIIIDGERRYRAAKDLGLLTIPCYVLPPPRDKMEYLLHMFRIHNVKEDWKLFPTAKKLEELIKSLKKQDPSRKTTNKALKAYTSMKISRIAQCRTLLTLPEKFQDQLFAEQKLEEKQDAIPSKWALTEDFFLELLGPIKALETDKRLKPLSDEIFAKHSKVEIIEKLVTKYKADHIPNITDFRLLTRIIKTSALSTNQRAKIVKEILTDKEYEITYAYDIYARAFYEVDSLERQCTGLTQALKTLRIEKVAEERRHKLLEKLEQLQSILAKRSHRLNSILSNSK